MSKAQEKKNSAVVYLNSTVEVGSNLQGKHARMSKCVEALRKEEGKRAYEKFGFYERK